MQKYEFQAEVKQLLDLMIHSLYSHKDIFLRELISNASDALDRLRFESLTRPELKPEGELQIRLDPDPTQRTLTVHDNGIGMTREEMVQNLGTIARSGTQEFIQFLKERKDTGSAPELIGQFGVGFYSSFMVADRIVVLSRKAGESQATRWQSLGDGAFTVEEAEREEPGTSVKVYLKHVDEEDGIQDYTKEWVLREIVKKYSDFVAYPIRLKVERKEIERDADGKPKAGAEEKTTVREETLNSMKALWTRPRKEVSEEEYHEFYKHISHDWQNPLEIVAARMEGQFEANALLFIPSHLPWDFFAHSEKRHGIQLYVKRVFIMDNCRELIPDYLQFVRGVVDSEALSLNVSREILQQDRQIRAIRTFLVKKVLDAFRTMLESDRARYAGFWKEFGALIKQGLYGREEKDRKETLLGILLAASSADGQGETTLREYVQRMKPGQDAIYFMTGPSREVVERSPHLEAFRQKGLEVLYLTDPVDELWTTAGLEFDGHKFQSVGKGEVDLEKGDDQKKSEQERKEKEKSCKALLEGMQKILSEEVQEVRFSARLVSSPACLVSRDQDFSPQLDELMRRMGQKVERKKRILELNPDHAIIVKLGQSFEKNPEAPELKDHARLLYGQALLAEGSPLPDGPEYGRLIAEMMTRILS